MLTRKNLRNLSWPILIEVAILLTIGVAFIHSGSGILTGPEGEAFLSLMRGARDGFRKPLAQVTLRPPVDAQLAKAYGEVGVGLFPTAERAVQAYAGVSAYEAFRAQIS